MRMLSLSIALRLTHTLTASVSHGTVDRHVSQGVIFPAWGQTVFRYHRLPPFSLTSLGIDSLKGTQEPLITVSSTFGDFNHWGKQAELCSSADTSKCCVPSHFRLIWYQPPLGTCCGMCFVCMGVSVPKCVNAITHFLISGRVTHNQELWTPSAPLQFPRADNGAEVRGQGMKAQEQPRIIQGYILQIEWLPSDKCYIWIHWSSNNGGLFGSDPLVCFQISSQYQEREQKGLFHLTFWYPQSVSFTAPLLQFSHVGLILHSRAPPLSFVLWFWLLHIGLFFPQSIPFLECNNRVFTELFYN